MSELTQEEALRRQEHALKKLDDLIQKAKNKLIIANAIAMCKIFTLAIILCVAAIWGATFIGTHAALYTQCESCSYEVGHKMAELMKEMDPTIKPSVIDLLQSFDKFVESIPKQEIKRIIARFEPLTKNHSGAAFKAMAAGLKKIVSSKTRLSNMWSQILFDMDKWTNENIAELNRTLTYETSSIAEDFNTDVDKFIQYLDNIGTNGFDIGSDNIGTNVETQIDAETQTD